MAVYNGGPYVRSTLDSILSQTGVDMEVIVVNDGSTDETAEVLREYEEGVGMIRCLAQTNKGVTRSLILACRMAGGDYIARHDVGDVSELTRLARQVDVLSQYPDVSMVSSWIRFRGPGDEPAGRVRRDPALADRELQIKDDEQKRVRGPYHGSTMFRKSDYEAVGGYRQEFYFAQDVDLWLRLHERGRHYIVPEELYTARLAPESISGRHRYEQDRCLELAVAAARARRNGESEEPFLLQAAKVTTAKEQSDRQKRSLQALSFYSMGCHLLNESPKAASRYFMKSIKVYPFYPKAWYRLAENLLLGGWRANR